MYAFTLLKWFQAVESYAVNPSLLLKLISNNYFFLTKIPILNLYVPQKSENLWLWECDPIQWHIPISLL